ncbi:polysaccharide pyruvyl transferase family protein [Cellulosimicrobium arenosum]|uniref:Polysaccharide pyruvyl transferase family protein n=1 Tax=Cellulosimicrobium arenosum TaxID=2708133 RepID=A0A927G9B1_9MICO|nr:polysaccharide pyruvyl transferase family protein [Cellulosimicrobium arenosum]MBD8079333.1 polysaccharide pyruvyl transferase family protein [Cellulosimicrobium arenosum]
MPSTTRPLRLLHLDLKTVYSYGDQLLFELVRHTFNGYGGGSLFDLTASHPFREPATRAWVDRVNDTFDGVVIGGGGIFPRRTNAARSSGWQWDIRTELLERLRVPIVVFGAGNPPVYDPDDHNPVFRRHINATVRRSVFVGLRSTGAADSLRAYLDDPQDAPVTVQPCPTTIGRHLLPSLAAGPDDGVRRLGLQLGLEGAHVESGLRPQDVFPRYVALVRALQEDGWDVEMVAHKRTDAAFHRAHGAELGIPLKRLYGSPDVLFRGVQDYARYPIVLGARGHSQMIPFGLGNVPLSLSTNDKIRYFAREIGHPELLVDPWADDLTDRALAAVHRADSDLGALRADLAGTQERFVRTTTDNLAQIYERISGRPVDAGIEPYSARELRLAEASYAADYARRELAADLAHERAGGGTPRPEGTAAAARTGSDRPATKGPATASTSSSARPASSSLRRVVSGARRRAARLLS